MKKILIFLLLFSQTVLAQFVPNIKPLVEGKEDKTNKTTDTLLGTSNNYYPTQKAVKTYTDNFGLGKLDKGYSISELRTLSNYKVLNTSVFYCNESGKEGFWKYDSSDNSSVDNVGTCLVTNSGKRLKRLISELTPSMFGCAGDGVTDDTQNFKDFLLEFGKYYKKADQVSAYSATPLGFSVIDLKGKSYVINDELSLPLVNGKSVSQVTIKNGTFIIGDGLKGENKYLWRLTNAENVDFESIVVYGKANDITNRNAFIVEGNGTTTVGVGVKFNKVRAFEISTFLKSELHTYDITITDCYIRNYSNQGSPCFVDIYGDAFINQNYFINCFTAIKTRGGNDLIRGNHFYGMKGFYAIDIISTSIGDIISNNYFDGCSLRANRYGTGLQLNDNFFQNCSLYTTVVLYSDGGSYVPANINIQNNNINFYSRTPIVSGVNYTYNSSNSTITFNSGVILDSTFVGSMIQVDINTRIQIYQVNSTTQALVKQIGRFDLLSGTYTGRIVPSNILVQNSEGISQMESRPNIFIKNNVLYNSSATLTEFPITLNESNEYYTRVTKNIISAYQLKGINPFTVLNDSDDYDAIKFQSTSNVIKGKLGFFSTGVRFQGGANNSSGLFLTTNNFFPQLTDSMNIGQQTFRFNNAYFKKVYTDGIRLNGYNSIIAINDSSDYKTIIFRNNAGIERATIGFDNSGALILSGNNVNNALILANNRLSPRTNLTLDLGTSALNFNNVYAKKLNLSTGSNASIGTATLVAGTVTVSTTAVTTNSLIYVQYHGAVTMATSVLTVPTITNATSFVITAITAGATTTNMTDTNTVKWWIIN